MNTGYVGGMANRTFAIGDIHGDLDALVKLVGALPPLDEGDTLVFVGDYLDRGPSSAGVIAYLRALPGSTPAKVVFLRGNHEDGWLRVIDRGWPEFVIPAPNGCLATLRSFLGRPPPLEGEGCTEEEMRTLFEGSFFPPDVVEWMIAFAQDHYVIEPKKRQRPESFKRLEDRFGQPASVSTVIKFGGGEGNG